MGFLRRVVIGLGHSFDLRLRTGERRKDPSHFQMRKLRLREHV